MCFNWIKFPRSSSSLALKNAIKIKIQKNNRQRMRKNTIQHIIVKFCHFFVTAVLIAFFFFFFTAPFNFFFFLLTYENFLTWECVWKSIRIKFPFKKCRHAYENGTERTKDFQLFSLCCVFFSLQKSFMICIHSPFPFWHEVKFVRVEEAHIVISNHMHTEKLSRDFMALSFFLFFYH